MTHALRVSTVSISRSSERQVIKLPDHQRVARAHVVERFRELGVAPPRAAGFFGENLLAATIVPLGSDGIGRPRTGRPFAEVQG
jgi:hypothetical protein